MALTAAEQAELDQLNAELGMNSGITPEEQAELDSLNAELGFTQKPQNGLAQALMALDPTIGATAAAKPVLEGMAAANRSIVQPVAEVADFLTGNNFGIAQAASSGTTGNFMQPGLAKDIVRGAGEAVPLAAAGGAALSHMARQLPMMSPAMQQQSAIAQALRSMGQPTPYADIATGAAAGAGAATGGAIGEQIGDQTGRQVGEFVGGLIAPAPSFLPRSLAASRVSPEARELLDRGVRLPPGAAYKGDIAQEVEKNAVQLPGFTGPITKQQNQALEDFNLMLLRQVAPEGTAVTMPGHQGFKELKQGFRNSYTRLWSQVTPASVNDQILNSRVNELMQTKLPYMADDTINQVKRITDAAAGQMRKFRESGNPVLLSDLDDKLRKAIRESKDDAAADYMQDLRAALRESMGPSGQALRELDRNYAMYDVLRRAGRLKNAAKRGSVFTPSEFFGAVTTKGRDAIPTDEALFQREARLGEETLGKLFGDRRETGIIRDPIGTPSGVMNAALRLGGAPPGRILAKAFVNEPMRQMLTSPVSDAMRRQQAIAAALRGAAGGNDLLDNLYED